MPSGTLTLPIFTVITALGWIRRITSRMPCLRIRRMRITFMPPPVEPEQPPTKAATNSRKGRAPGQVEKSATAKPAVVATETTSNTAWRSPWAVE